MEATEKLLLHVSKDFAAESWELKYNSKHKKPFAIVPFNEQVNGQQQRVLAWESNEKYYGQVF